MKDLFQDYKKQHSKKNTLIIMASLAFAFSINTFLFGTDVGTRLQTSIMNSASDTATVATADIIVVSAGSGTDMLKIQTTKFMQNVVKMEIPVAFDPEWLAINNVFSEDKDVEIINSTNIPGNSIIYINFNKPRNIAEKTNLLTLVYKKTVPKTILNLGETSFISINGERYFLNNTPFEF